MGNKSFEAFPVSTFQVLVLHGSEFHFGSSFGKAGSGSGPELNSPHDPVTAKGALRFFVWVEGGWVDFLFGCGEKRRALAIKSRQLEQKNSSLFLYKKPPAACAGYYSKARLSFWGETKLLPPYFCAKVPHSLSLSKALF